jgi:hypothetical protein
MPLPCLFLYPNSQGPPSQQFCYLFCEEGLFLVCRPRYQFQTSGLYHSLLIISPLVFHFNSAALFFS